MRMVKSRQKKLDERWGLERSAKGGRFKLNRDLVGYHLTAREEITQREEEGGAKIKVLDPGPLKVKGSLAHLEGVSLGYSGKGKTPGKVVLEGVNMTIEQGGRVALIGAVSGAELYLAGSEVVWRRSGEGHCLPRRTVKANRQSPRPSWASFHR
jgi:ATP-binding cassette subfamily F protein 3